VAECCTVSVVNWKGGVGKTTLTHHLAVGLQVMTEAEREEKLGMRRKPRVLLIDNDAQCNLTISCLGSDKFDKMVERGSGTMRELYATFLRDEDPDSDVEEFIVEGMVRKSKYENYEDIDVLSSHPDLIYTDMDFAIYSEPDFKKSMLGSNIYKFQVLDRILERVRERYDFIFIDCPPSMHYLTQNSIYTSDYYLIPMLPDWLSTYGIHSIVTKVDELNRMFRLAEDGNYVETELVGIVANKVREYKEKPIQSQSAIINDLKEQHRDQVFAQYLTDGDGISQASSMGVPVYAIAGSGGTARKQSELLQEILGEFLDKI